MALISLFNEMGGLLCAVEGDHQTTTRDYGAGVEPLFDGPDSALSTHLVLDCVPRVEVEEHSLCPPASGEACAESEQKINDMRGN